MIRMFKGIHYSQLMHLRTLEICIFKIYKLNPAKTKAKLDLLSDIDMLLLVEKGIRGGLCHSIYRYEKS